MNLIFWNDKRSAKCRKFSKIEHMLHRYKFLLAGEIGVKEMMNMKTMKEFYRPTLNGIMVAFDEKKMKQFKSENAAFKEGEKISELLKKAVSLSNPT